MPLPDTFTAVRSHPRWLELSIPEQNQIRYLWAQRRLIASDRPRDPKLYQQFLDEAFLDAPEWAKPMQPLSETRIAWRALKGVGGEMLEPFLRAARVPQQLVAHLIKPPITGERYKVSPRGALQATITPFKRVGEYYLGKKPEERFTKTAFAEPILQTLTDPLMYIGAGLAPRVRDITRLAKLREAGVLRPVPPLYGRGAREALEAATKLKPGMMAEIEMIPRAWATFSPQQRTIYRQVLNAGRANIESGQLKRIAETAANATPEEAGKIIEVLRSGNLNKIRSVISWAESALWKRTPFKGMGQRVKPPTAGAKAPISPEDITTPGYVADTIEALAKETGMM